MKENGKFPGKLEWVLLAGGTALVLNNSGAKPVEGQAPTISTETPIPVLYQPNYGPFPIAERRWCDDYTLKGKRSSYEESCNGK